jgi:hypothetical protein
LISLNSESDALSLELLLEIFLLPNVHLDTKQPRTLFRALLMEELLNVGQTTLGPPTALAEMFGHNSNQVMEALMLRQKQLEEFK